MKRNYIKQTILIVASMLFAKMTSAQMNAYSVSDTIKTYTPLVTTAGTQVFSGAAINGNTVCCYNIGFNFVMDGSTFDRLYINSRGYLSLINATVTGGVGTTTPLSTTTSQYLISALASTNGAGGLRSTSASSEVRFNTIGTAPFRVFIVEWKQFGFEPISGGEDLNFQIRLFETTNSIEIGYGNMTKNTTDRQLQVGVKGANNNSYVAMEIPATGSWNSPNFGTSVPITSVANLSLSNGTVPANGLTFRFDPPAFDAAVASIASFPFCGSSSTPLDIVIKNNGSQDITNFPITAIVTGTVGGSPYSNTFNYTHTGTVPKFSTQKITIGSMPNSTSGANLNVTTYVSLASDVYRANDTLIRNGLTINGNPSATPSPLNFDYCGSGPKNLASGITPAPGSSVAWFDSPTSQAPVAFGTNWTTPSLAAPSTNDFYYANSYVSNNMVYENSPYGGGGWFGYGVTHGFFVRMEPLNNIVLDRVSFFSWAQTANSPTKVTVYYRLGDWQGNTGSDVGWIKHAEVDLILANTGQETIADIPNLIIPAGQVTAFYLCIEAGTPWDNLTNNTPLGNEDFILYSGPARSDYFNTSGGISNNAKWRGKFYYNTFCLGPKALINVDVDPLPTGAEIKASSVFNGIFSGGTEAFPDIVGESDQVVYSLDPPTAYSNASFGSQWFITDLSIMTPTGYPVNSSDTSTTMPSVNGNGTLSFTPSVGTGDSLYKISITLRSAAFGCDSILTRYVYVAPRPVSGFAGVNVCQGEKTVFDNQSTIARGTMEYKWYFGDGAASEKKSPEHVYAAPGTYQVSLVVISGYGYKDSSSASVSVFEKPSSGFTFVNACEGDSISFTSTLSQPTGNEVYSWNFGNSITSGLASPKLVYNNPGEYEVTLKVTLNGCVSNETMKLVTQYERAVPSFTSVANCSNEDVIFTNQSTISSGNVSYTWDFGGATLVNGKDQVHRYAQGGNHSVILYAYTDHGCLDSFAGNVSVKQAPLAAFTVSDVCHGDTVFFINTTTEPAGTTMSYSWIFDDAQSSNIKDPKRIMMTGNWNAILYSLSSNGCFDTTEWNVIVFEKPVAGATVANVCEGTGTQFINTSQGSGQYTWDFGDPSNPNDQSSDYEPLFVYSTSGSFEAKLLIDNGACSDEVSVPVTVNPLPDAGFATQKMAATGQFEFLANDVSLSQYRWRMGDGTSATGSWVSYEYLNDGVYVISLQVTDNKGCSSSSDDTVTVFITSIKGSLFENGTVKVYPNPNNGTFKLDWNLGANTAQVIVINTLSHPVWEGSLDDAGSQQLDLSNLASGVYFVKVVMNGEVNVQRIIIQK